MKHQDQIYQETNLQQSLAEIRGQINKQLSASSYQVPDKKQEDEVVLEIEDNPTKGSGFFSPLQPKFQNIKSPNVKMHPISTPTGFWLTNKPQPDSPGSRKFKLPSSKIETRYKSIDSKAALTDAKTILVRPTQICTKQLKCIERNSKLTTSHQFDVKAL